MNKQTIEIAIHTQNGVIHSIGKSIVYIPTIKSSSGTIKWYDDKKKEN